MVTLLNTRCHFPCFPRATVFYFFILENLIMVTAINGLRGPGSFGPDFRPTNYKETLTLLSQMAPRH